MAGYSRDQVMTKAVRASEDMFNAVHLSFGPEGLAVLAQSSSRLVITRSGSQILRLVFPTPHPVLSVLLDSADKLHAATGDGVKSFVIVVKALLRQTALKDVPSFVNKLSILQTRLSLSFQSACDCVLTNKVLHNVISTFFNTRFPQAVSETLVSLVVDWVSKLDSIKSVDCYVNNFSLLCFKFSPFPVTASSVQDGFLIKGHWSKRFALPRSLCILKVYYHSLETSIEDGEVEMDIVEVLKEINDCKSVIFITNLVLNDRARYQLSTKDIFFVHGTCLDTAKFLFEQSLGKELVVECKLVNNYLWISLPVHQLLLKAPSEYLASEYAEGISDCVKMLNFCFKRSECTVVAGGHFELALAKKLFNLSDSSCKRIPPVECREQLLLWRQTHPMEVDLLKHLEWTHLKGMDSQVVDIFCRSLLAIKTINTDIHSNLEPIALRLEILCRALNVTAIICQMDCAIFKPKKTRL